MPIPVNPWTKEPNKKVWNCDETSLNCVIERNMYGSLDGYITIDCKHFNRYDFNRIDQHVENRYIFVTKTQHGIIFKLCYTTQDDFLPNSEDNHQMATYKTVDDVTHDLLMLARMINKSKIYIIYDSDPANDTDDTDDTDDV